MGFTPTFYIDSDASNSANSFGEFEEMWLRMGGDGNGRPAKAVNLKAFVRVIFLWLDLISSFMIQCFVSVYIHYKY